MWKPADCHLATINSPVPILLWCCLFNDAVRGWNPGGGEIFRTRPDRPWGLPSLLYNGYRVIPGSKAAGVWC
jgi:hypothetical protein